MKQRQEFKKDAYQAALLLVDAGLGDVVLAFDYKLEGELPDNVRLGVVADAAPSYRLKFFQLHASDLVQGVDTGDLPL